MIERSLANDTLDTNAKIANINVCCGTTCACLGDERNLREFVVADETARQLRGAGHIVTSYLISDNLDPLNRRQLRVAFNKNDALVEEWAEWCGKPIAHVPDPWGCHSSYSAHFEEALLNRLGSLGCHFNLVSADALYKNGLYAPYVKLVLAHYDEIMHYITGSFPGYHPETLFYPLCPKCGCLDETVVEGSNENNLKFYCRRCECSSVVGIDEAKGKLNWKLDCAVRWNVLHINAETFSKAYLEPKSGSYVVAQGLSKKFFGGQEVLPLRYGLVKMSDSVSYQLLSSLPADLVRRMFAERATADLAITPEYIITAASRYHVDSGLSYLNCINQMVPLWLLRTQTLNDRQRDLVARGVRFTENFLHKNLALQLPTREKLECVEPAVIGHAHRFLVDIIRLRKSNGVLWDSFCEPAKHRVASLGKNKSAVISCLRSIVGQKQGVPAARLFFYLPLDYLQMLEYVFDLRANEIDEDSHFISAAAI